MSRALQSYRVAVPEERKGRERPLKALFQGSRIRLVLPQHPAATVQSTLRRQRPAPLSVCAYFAAARFSSYAIAWSKYCGASTPSNFTPLMNSVGVDLTPS